MVDVSNLNRFGIGTGPWKIYGPSFRHPHGGSRRQMTKTGFAIRIEDSPRNYNRRVCVGVIDGRDLIKPLHRVDCVCGCLSAVGSSLKR